MSFVKIGVAGPVGSGKTALIESLTRQMAADYSIGVITNDIYTKEDAEFLSRNSILPRERIIGVETVSYTHLDVYKRQMVIPLIDFFIGHLFIVN